MSKRKKNEKQKDFAKKKLKVGKTAAKPDNHTDTSFTARAISIPNQSIAQKQTNSNNKSSTNRDIDFAHQFQLVKHHSPQTRAEVLAFIEKHLPENDPLIYRLMITAVTPLVVDTSNNVRNSLILLLKSAAKTLPDTLELNIKGLSLFIHSAMTHIQPDIRNSSLKFLDVLVESTPGALCKGHFVKTMKCYFSLMAWPLKDDKKSVLLAITTSASTGGATKKARVHHLNILLRFLTAALFDDPLQKMIIDSSNTVLVHPLTGKYIFPGASRPFAPLKLFVKELAKSSGLNMDDGRYLVEDLISLSTEGLETRRKIVIDVFLQPMLKNLKSLVKEGGEVGREARSVEIVLEKLVESEKKEEN